MDKMSIELFAEEVCKGIENKYPSYIATTNKITKNNNVVLQNIRIKEDAEEENEGPNVTPSLYINGFYDRDCSVEETVDKIMELYEENKNTPFDIAEVSKIGTKEGFDVFNDRIVPRLINMEKNSSALSDMAYIPFGDLAITFYILLGNKDASGSVTVSNRLLYLWNKTVTDLLNVSFVNLENIFKFKMENIASVLERMMSKETVEEMRISLDDFSLDMNVVSNDRGSFGSIYLTNKKILDKIANKLNTEEFYIIPSSIHELIVFSVDEFNDENNSIEGLKEMVFDVNRSQLQEHEVLSDNVYRYNAKEHILYDANDKLIPFVY